jgi:hypothetical protein
MRACQPLLHARRAWTHSLAAAGTVATLPTFPSSSPLFSHDPRRFARTLAGRRARIVRGAEDDVEAPTRGPSVGQGAAARRSNDATPEVPQNRRGPSSPSPSDVDDNHTADLFGDDDAIDVVGSVRIGPSEPRGRPLRELTGPGGAAARASFDEEGDGEEAWGGGGRPTDDAAAAAAEAVASPAPPRRTSSFFIESDEEGDDRVRRALLAAAADGMGTGPSTSSSPLLLASAANLPATIPVAVPTATSDLPSSLAPLLSVREVPVQPPSLAADDVDRIVAVADGDVAFALEIRGATLARRRREALHRARTQAARITSLAEVAREEFARIEAAAARLSIAADSSSSSADATTLTAASPSSSSGQGASLIAPADILAFGTSPADTPSLLVSAAAHAVAAESSPRGLRAGVPSPLNASTPLPSTLHGLRVRAAVLQAAHALATTSTGPIGPGDGGALEEVATRLGIDLGALKRRQARAALRDRDRRSASERARRVAAGLPVAGEEEEGSIFSGDEEETAASLRGEEDGMLEASSSSLWSDSDAEREADGTFSPRSPLTSTLDPEDPMRGLALPDTMLTRRGVRVPDDPAVGSTRDLVIDETWGLDGPSAPGGEQPDPSRILGPELTVGRASLRKLRARSELMHAEKVLLRAIAATAREGAGTEGGRGTRRPLLGSGAEEVAGGASTVTDLQTRGGDASPAADQTSGATDLAPRPSSSPANPSRIGSKVAGSPGALAPAMPAGEVRALLRDLGFPERDDKGRALIPREEALQAIRAYRKSMRGGGDAALQAHARARAAQAAAFLNARDAKEMVRLIFEAVDKEDLARGEEGGARAAAEVLGAEAGGEEEGAGAAGAGLVVSGGANGVAPASSLIPTTLVSDTSLGGSSAGLVEVPARLSLLPAGFRTWGEVSASHATRAKRDRKSSAALRAQQQQTLDATIRPVKPSGEDKVPTPRQVRVAANITACLANELAASPLLRERYPDLYPGGFPLDIHECQVTPDLRTCYVRWRLPYVFGEVAGGEEDVGAPADGGLAGAAAGPRIPAPAFASLLERAAAPSLRPATASARARTPHVAYDMEAPEAASARAILASSLARQERRADSVARSKRRPRAADKFAANRAESDPSLVSPQAAAWKPAAERALERAGGVLRRTVARKLALRFTPLFEFHYHLEAKPKPVREEVGEGDGVGVGGEEGASGRAKGKGKWAREDEEAAARRASKIERRFSFDVDGEAEVAMRQRARAAAAARG